jgi:hypothetical protein
MTTSLKFRVEAADKGVVVTLDGRTYMVRYCKNDNQAGLCSIHEETLALRSTTSTFSLAHGSSPTLR